MWLWYYTSSVSDTDVLLCFFFQPISNADFIVPVEIDGTVHQVLYYTHTKRTCWVNKLVFLLGARVPKDPEENGCDPVQVIQDRLCVSWLAYSWLLALGGSCWSKRRVSKPWVRVTSLREGGHQAEDFDDARHFVAILKRVLVCNTMLSQYCYKSHCEGCSKFCSFAYLSRTFVCHLCCFSLTWPKICGVSFRCMCWNDPMWTSFFKRWGSYLNVCSLRPVLPRCV